MSKNAVTHSRFRVDERRYSGYLSCFFNIGDHGGQLLAGCHTSAVNLLSLRLHMGIAESRRSEAHEGSELLHIQVRMYGMLTPTDTAMMTWS